MAITGGDPAYINGNLVSWSDLIWLVSYPDLGNFQRRFFGFRAIDFGSEKRERPPQYGQNRAAAPIGLPAGKYTPPAPKITFHAHTMDADERAPYDSFIEALRKAAPDGNSYGNVRMNWQLQVNNNRIYTEYNWYDLYIVENNASWEETAEGLFKEVGFQSTRFNTNGATLYDSSEEY
jgi:hypothetical protein